MAGWRAAARAAAGNARVVRSATLLDEGGGQSDSSGGSNARRALAAVHGASRVAATSNARSSLYDRASFLTINIIINILFTTQYGSFLRVVMHEYTHINFTEICVRSL